jgi:hypothetical protein
LLCRRPGPWCNSGVDTARMPGEAPRDQLCRRPGPRRSCGVASPMSTRRRHVAGYAEGGTVGIALMSIRRMAPVGVLRRGAGTPRGRPSRQPLLLHRRPPLRRRPRGLCRGGSCPRSYADGDPRCSIADGLLRLRRGPAAVGTSADSCSVMPYYKRPVAVRRCVASTGATTT